MYQRIEFFEHPTFKGYYASEDGKILKRHYGNSIEDNPRVLKQSINNKGYLVIRINGVSKRVHRIVWECCKNQLIPKGMQINHIDENKQNNNINNLELCTAKENVNWGTRNKRASEALKGRTLSKEHKRKMSEAHINNKSLSKQILQIDKISGEVIKEWPSMHEVERRFGYFQSAISACCLGKQKTAYNYIWRYA